MDADESVYAAILTRVKRPELDEQLHAVLQKEYRSIGRQVRRASSSLAAVRKLQAAAEFLRPSGDWQPKTLQTHLKRMDQLQSRLETALVELERGKGRTKKKKKKRRPVEEEEDSEKEEHINKKMKKETMKEEKVRDRETVVLDEDYVEEENDWEIVEMDETEKKVPEEEFGVEFLQVVTPGDRGTHIERGEDERMEKDDGTVEKCAKGDDPLVNDSIEDEEEECEVEILEVVASNEGMEESVEVERVKEESAVLEIHGEDNDGDEETNEEVGVLPNGLVKTTHQTTVRVKEETVELSDQQPLLEVSQQEASMDEAGNRPLAESPIELEVPESSEESAVELEMPDSEESAMELEVLDSDSDSDDDFSSCRELVTKLQTGNDATQLLVLPQTVMQLRSYLIDCKHFEVDEYLFAHKSITDAELKEMGHAIETIVSVGTDLPRRPRVKMALNDLLTIVEQLEHTMGELPALLYPVVEKLSNYFSPIVK
ncbi:hypothetical protein PR003_g23247 [Phytophthora rubi]|uniref:Uncharacterized protein n=2 Tax=Phytophthora TaxID=4783 RepID=A0A6A4CWZ2_9STRA|nr:hypothetical protein PR001_g23113 [Phytophthora rubi]KAE8984811.1 hypothetical protein PR002_g22827 [Phytophthora rubi]KAE9298405.1 hypothetical protein PR003_g23247 [Phytophthora rubi]